MAHEISLELILTYAERPSEVNAACSPDRNHAVVAALPKYQCRARICWHRTPPHSHSNAFKGCPTLLGQNTGRHWEVREVQRQVDENRNATASASGSLPGSSSSSLPSYNGATQCLVIGAGVVSAFHTWRLDHPGIPGQVSKRYRLPLSMCSCSTMCPRVPPSKHGAPGRRDYSARRATSTNSGHGPTHKQTSMSTSTNTCNTRLK